MLRLSKYSLLEPYWKNENSKDRCQKHTTTINDPDPGLNMKTVFIDMKNVFPGMVFLL